MRGSHRRLASGAVLALGPTAGADLRRYLVGSLLDDFEGARSYGKRFGIVHVGSTGQRRLPEDSARWFRDVIARNGLGEEPA